MRSAGPAACERIWPVNAMSSDFLLLLRAMHGWTCSLLHCGKQRPMYLAHLEPPCGCTKYTALATCYISPLITPSKHWTFFAD